MSIITNILYWLSSGMLVPVIITLLIAFAFSLMMIGDLYGHFAQRMKNRQHVTVLLERVESESVQSIEPDHVLPGNSLLRDFLARFRRVNWNLVHGDKILADYEINMKKNLESPLLLMRVGPMLGLMGTLIPMGPALVGLAAGDIQSMALNMRVAFSTTVIGLFTGAIGFIVQLFRQRWLREDGETLQYLFDLAQSQENGK